MAWWTTHTAGEPLSVIALQVDLAGHSAAVHNADDENAVARSLAEFAQVLEVRLAYDAGFDLVFWAGDGGLFTKKTHERGAADTICDAADSAFKWFGQWRQESWQEGLDLRMSATYLATVILNPSVGHWYSPGLNDV